MQIIIAILALLTLAIADHTLDRGSNVSLGLVLFVAGSVLLVQALVPLRR